MQVKGALVVMVPEAGARELVEAGHAAFFDPGARAADEGVGERVTGGRRGLGGARPGGLRPPAVGGFEHPGWPAVPDNERSVKAQL
jgi:hypothetical protein